MFKRNLVGVLTALGEMDGRVEVCASMLGGAKRVGLVVPPTFRHTPEIAFQFESRSRWPVNGIGSIGMAEIGDSGPGEHAVRCPGGIREGRSGDQQQRNKSDGFHGVDLFP